MSSTPSDSPPAARVAITPRAMEEGAASSSESVVATKEPAEPAERRVPVLDDEDEYEVHRFSDKVMLHLREASDRLNLTVPFLPKAPAPHLVASSRSVVPGTTTSDQKAAPHWNLRKRSKFLRAHEDQERVSRFPPATAETQTVRLRTERQKCPKFSLSLTKDEIEEDLYSMTSGCRARRGPRKRPTAVQKQIDTLFPGSRLSEITGDSYKLPHER